MFLEKLSLFKKSENKNLDVINFKIEKRKKQDFFNLCKDKNITPTTLLNNFIEESLIEGDNDYTNLTTSKKTKEELLKFLNDETYQMFNNNSNLDKNGFNLGRTLNKNNLNDFYIKNESDFIILGPTGSGKSNIVYNFMDHKFKNNDSFIYFNISGSNWDNNNIQNIAETNFTEKNIHFVNYENNEEDIYNNNILNTFNHKELILLMLEFFNNNSLDSFFNLQLKDWIEKEILKNLKINNLKKSIKFMKKIFDYENNEDTNLNSLKITINLFVEYLEKTIKLFKNFSFDFNSSISETLNKGDSLIINLPYLSDSENQDLIKNIFLLMIFNDSNDIKYQKDNNIHFIFENLHFYNTNDIFYEKFHKFMALKRKNNINTVFTLQCLGDFLTEKNNIIGELFNFKLIILNNNKKEYLIKYFNIPDIECEIRRHLKLGESIVYDFRNGNKNKVVVNNLYLKNYNIREKNIFKFEIKNNDNNLINIKKSNKLYNKRLKDFKSKNYSLILDNDNIKEDNINNENLKEFKENYEKSFFDLDRKDFQNIDLLNKIKYKYEIFNNFEINFTEFNSNTMILSNEKNLFIDLFKLDNNNFYTELINLLNKYLILLYKDKNTNVTEINKEINFLIYKCDKIETLLLGIYSLIIKKYGFLNLSSLKTLKYKNYYLYCAITYYNPNNNFIDSNGYIVWKELFDKIK